MTTAGASLVAAVALVAVVPTAAQEPSTPRVTISANRLVASDSTGEMVEPHLSVSPVDPRHVVAAAMIIREPDFSVMDCALLTSFDGFESTTRHDLGLEQCGDPWTLITEAGTAIVTVLSERGLLVYRSPDGGRSWPSEPLVIDGAHDHEMLTADRATGAIYLVSGLSARSPTGTLQSLICVARSTDDGRTFEEMGRTAVSNMSYEAMTPVVASDSELLIPLQDHHRGDGERVRMRRAWLLASSDGGRTTAPPRLINEGCNRRGPVGWPSLGIVPTGARTGAGDAAVDRLVWLCEREEHDGIDLFTSDDRGESWTGPRRVDEEREGAWTKVPTVAVDARGAVAVAWSDRGPGEDCHALRVAISFDAAETFAPPRQIASERSCPVDTDVGARFPAGGDYIGLAATSPRSFLALWSDARDGVFRLYRATVSVREE
ncbi:MAG: sialidase family protein [Gemmatimonadota bacterium]|nr:sialidase family protein [Gemmatimonadota bacterium]